MMTWAAGETERRSTLLCMRDVCMCNNENYFSVFVVQSIVTIQHQVCEE